jgi:hypothetical protein
LESETGDKMMTIKEKVVECRGKGSDTNKFSGNCWEGGIRMTVGAWFVLALPPQPLISGSFSPIGRKVLKVMMGAATIGRDTRLRT